MKHKYAQYFFSAVVLVGMLLSLVQPTPVTAQTAPEPPNAGVENVTGSTVNSVDPLMLPPGSPFDLCFNITEVSNDAEYLDRFEFNLPDNWTVNNVYDTPANGCGYGHTFGTDAGNIVNWTTNGYPGSGCGDWLPGTYDFCANITVPDCTGANWSIPWTIYGDTWGSPPHSVSGTYELLCLQDGVYLSPELAEGEGCNGDPADYDFSVYNNTGSDTTFNLTYSIVDGVGELTGPATLYVANGSTANLTASLTPDVCSQPGALVVGQVDVTGAGFSDTSLINHTVTTGAGCPTCDLQGTLEGTVLDAELGGENPTCTGATVTVNPGGYVLPVDPGTGAYGPIDLVQGDYTLEAAAEGFPTETAVVTIVDEEPTIQDFALARPVIEVAPTELNVSAPYSIPVTVQVDVSNLGSLPLDFNVRDNPDIGAATALRGITQAVMPATPTEKFEDLLVDQLAAGPADFFVWMAEKADLTPAYSMATKEEKGRFVFNALRSTAERTQADLLAQLKQMGVKYTSFYIANKVLVQGGTQALADQIAARSDVYKLTANHTFQLQEPFKYPTAPTVSPETVEGNIAFVYAPEVWDMGFTGQGMIVAGNDTGLDETVTTIARHYRGCLNPPDCTSWDHNYNWYDATGTYPTNPYDGFGHGTHTTGTMVGDDGGTNQIGMAPGAQTIHCKNMTDGGSGDDNTFTTCFEWDLAPWDLNHANPLPEMAPDSVNNSWGYWGGSAPQFEDEIAALQAAGILVEVSAGNEGPGCGTLRSPGDYLGVLTTGSIDDEGQTFPGIITVSYWSTSRGPSDLYPGEYFPDIMAPGNNVRSQLPGGSFESWGGTSMAGPHATALVGLIWSAAPALRGNVAETIDIIQQTAGPLTGQNGSSCGGDYTVGPNNDWGYGTINSLAAVEEAIRRSDLPWVWEEPITGTIPAFGEQTIDVTFLCGLDQVGQTLTGTIHIENNDPCQEDVTIPLSFFCVLEAVPDISVTPPSLDVEVYAGETTTSLINLENVGTADLTFDLSWAEPWLDLVPVSGTIPLQQTQEVVATFDATALAIGNYTDTITVASNDPDQPEILLPVNLSVVEKPAELEVSPLAITATVYAGDTGMESFTIANLGQADLEFNVTETLDWLSVDPVTGTVPGLESITADVNLDATALVTGTYTGAISVLSNGGDAEVFVTLNVIERPNEPDIDVTPLVLAATLGPNATEVAALTISDNGLVTVTFAIAEDPEVDWLAVEPVSGSVAPDSATEALVTFDATGLAAGEYTTTLVVASNDPDEPEVVVEVSLTVLAAPDIAVEPAAVEMTLVTGTTGTTDLFINNIGNAELEVMTITWEAADWLTLPVTLPFTVTAGGQVDLALGFDTAGLAIGTYTTTLTIDSNDPDQPEVSVPVTLIVAEPPVFKAYLPVILQAFQP